MSASSSSTTSHTYDVFLSFRGEDTRHSFVSHLHKALDQRGIVTFFDEIDIEKGQSISPELSKSITESRFAIIVFSKDYASSTWCLDELVKIMECRSKNNQTVIPIFYDVDPSDVRTQKNTFGEAFAKHEVQFKDNIEKVQIWKENLREVASISGHDLSQRNVTEASCINKIVDDIFSKLPHKASTKGLVGMENQIKKFKSLLAEEENGVRFVGIWGMGGIGKTTTARAIYDELIGGFECGCFLRDVYKRSMVELQRCFLSEVLKAQTTIYDEDQGRSVISNRLGSKRLLLVLDDVNDEKQIEALAGDCDWFGDGSRVIITTRDKHLLTDVNELYEMETLFDNEAIELFSLHAFKKSHPPDDFVKLSYRVLEYASGLPLALKVLGSHLRGRQMYEWESTLGRLKYAPEDKINASLKISFDGLSNNQQSMFLDIACFFRGCSKDIWIKKLEELGYHAADGIEILQEKSLVYIIDSRLSSEIQMHDLIEDMAQNIVRQKAEMNPGKYSRLWDDEDIINVLRNVTGTNEVEGLVLKEPVYIKFKLNESVFRNMNRLRLLIMEINIDSTEDSVIPRWLYWWKDPLKSSHYYLPNSLRCLCWWRYPGKFLPVDFKPRNLVSLDLSISTSLQTCPDVSYMPNLETLNLCHCEKLLEVHPSVVAHKKLVCLDLSSCFVLKKIPGTMQMKSLETLKLYRCYRLRSLPEFASNMSSLRTIDLHYSGITYLPRSLEHLTGLQKINLNDCRSLKARPNNLESCFDTVSSSLKGKRADIGDASKILTALLSLPSLRELDMRDCNVSELILPESNGCFDSLEILNLSENKFVSLPESINRFSCLRDLNLQKCRNLEALPEFPPWIKELDLEGCAALTSCIPDIVDLLDKYKNLQLLSLIDCEKLVQNQDQLEQLLPQCLLGLMDSGTAVSNILCNRQEAVQFNFPGNHLFNWLHKSTGRGAIVTLSPSCFYSDKLRGFVICAISNYPFFQMVTDNSRVKLRHIITGNSRESDLEHIFFFYIPIGKLTRGIERNEIKNNCLLEVSSTYICGAKEIRWGISLVYDTEVDMDFSDLTVTNRNLHPHADQIFKVCVAPRIQI